MKLRYFIGVIIFIMIFIGAIELAGVPLEIFLDWISFLILIITTSALLLINFELKDLGQCFSHAFAKAVTPGANYDKDLTLVKALRGYVYLSAAIGLLTGILCMLGNVKDVSILGRGASIALLCLYYAMILDAILVLPLTNSLKKFQSLKQTE